MDGEISSRRPRRSTRGSLQTPTLEGARRSSTEGELSEVAAPVLFPHDSTDESNTTITRERTDLEQARSHSTHQQSEELNEVLAPELFPHESQPGGIEAEKTHAKEYSPALQIVYTVSWLILASFYGTLARLGLISLSRYQGSPVLPQVWPQIVGCLVIGFLVEDRARMCKENKSLIVFVGMTTGFCGSITTFSTWILDVYLSMSNYDPSYERAKGSNFLAMCAQLAVVLSMSFAFLRAGAWTAVLLDNTFDTVPRPVRLFSLVDMIVPFVAVLHWIGIVLAAVFMPVYRGVVLFAVVLAPLGTLARWRIAQFNRLTNIFPLGTFIANTLGTIILSVCLLLQTTVPVSRLQCQILQGIMDGFCGCLTTLSTFMVEITSLQPRHSILYAGTSIVTGFVLMVLITGIDVSEWLDCLTLISSIGLRMCIRQFVSSDLTCHFCSIML